MHVEWSVKFKVNVDKCGIMHMGRFGKKFVMN